MADEDPRRYKFQKALEEALGSKNVYFQPPESVRMEYPAIVYSRRSTEGQHADNEFYRAQQGYDVTVIARDPDFIETLKLHEKFPMCNSDRSYVADNLVHDNYVIYY